VNSAGVSGFSRGAPPSTSPMAAAYTRASPRAFPTAPAGAEPSARTARVLANSTGSVGGSACRLNGMPTRAAGSGPGPAAPGIGRTGR
jgi:hypothetical protein